MSLYTPSSRNSRALAGNKNPLVATGPDARFVGTPRKMASPFLAQARNSCGFIRWLRRRAFRNAGGLAGSEIAINQQQALAFSLDEFELADDAVEVLFLFHLFRDEPLQEGMRGVIFGSKGEFHQGVDAAGDELFVLEAGLKHVKSIFPIIGRHLDALQGDFPTTA